MADPQNQEDQPLPDNRHGRELTGKEKECAFLMLKSMVENGRLSHGSIAKTARAFGTSRPVVSRIWNAGVTYHVDSKRILSMDVTKVVVRRGNCGRNLMYPMDEFAALLRSLPITQKKTLRDISENLRVPKTTVHRMKGMEGATFRAHTNAVLTVLTEENKLARLAWCMDKREENGRYSEMLDEVHVDEKWFNLTEKNARYYITDGEEPATRRTKSKNFIDKVMFLAAVARPRWDYNRRRMWDGKIGMWPIGKFVAAQRASRNRPRGTLEFHSESVDGAKYLELIVEKVIPAIAEKCPVAMKARKIVLQQDNAPPHFTVDSNQEEVALTAAELDLHLEIRNQPPNSPDLNILDLSVFRALQSAYYKNVGGNKAELIERVLQCFERYSHTKVNNSFLTLMCCMNEIVKVNGDNCYKIPHMSKSRLERDGVLPRSIDAFVGGNNPFDIESVHDQENDDDLLLE